MYYLKKEYTDSTLFTATKLSIELLKLELEQFEKLTSNLEIATQLLLSQLRKENLTSCVDKEPSKIPEFLFSRKFGNYVQYKIVVDLSYIYFIQAQIDGSKDAEVFINRENYGAIPKNLLSELAFTFLNFLIPSIDEIDFTIANNSNSYVQTFYFIEDSKTGSVSLQERIK